MAPELENHWFIRKGGSCGLQPVGWHGVLATSLYSAAVTGGAWVLADRTIPGAIAAILLMTAIFLIIVVAKTRDGSVR